MSTTFQAWPKTPRLFRDMTITEKIDGTNSAVLIYSAVDTDDDCRPGKVTVDGLTYVVAAQSRKRLIDPTDDNFGFAAWVRNNASALVSVLGEGHHFGEWWGSGIQRGYGLTKGDRRFSLFNVHRYSDLIHSGPVEVPGLDVVPVLARYTFDTDFIRDTAARLAVNGSLAAPGFAKPEGLIVHHAAANSVFKVLLEGDDTPKGLSA